jgi:transcriptional regulator GlxA family with amidase domain
MYSECLATAYPSIQVDSSLIFARDGNIYSSGGITAGIDLAMALVEEDLGREIPLAIARMMVVFPRRPGGQSQFSAYVNAAINNRFRNNGSACFSPRTHHPSGQERRPARRRRKTRQSARSFKVR